MLDLPVTERRHPQSYTLLPTTIARVKTLAELYDVSASRILEAMIIQYAPKLLEQKQKNPDA